jgi:osmotically-inducible protein OsmY
LQAAREPTPGRRRWRTRFASRWINLDIKIDKNLDAALIQNKLNRDISYDVKNGVVTLKGNVNSEIRRNQAAHIASSVPNVQQVVNELQVKNQKASSTN